VCLGGNASFAPAGGTVKVEVAVGSHSAGDATYVVDVFCQS